MQRKVHPFVAGAILAIACIGALAEGSTDAASAAASAPTAQGRTPPAQATRLADVVITGSRLPAVEAQGAIDVRIYDRERIERSGRATVTEFLATLPEVSLNSVESTDISTTVRLRGARSGSALVLINGRRTQSVSGSAGQAGYFDLNTIPASMVERIEVLPTASSAVYGGDALAGVVNIILRQGFTGFEASAGYKWADQTDESLFYVGGGWKTGDLAASVMLSYSNRGSLEGKDRAITGSQDLRPLGGPNLGINQLGAPANVFAVSGNLPGLTSSFAAVPHGSTGIGLTPADFVATQGTQNLGSFTQYQSSIFGLHRAGFYADATWSLANNVEVFAELLATDHTLKYHFTPPFLSLAKVPASNPFNPFGTTVQVSGLVIGTESMFWSSQSDTFVRPLLGARGKLGNWQWEATAQESRDFGERFTYNAANPAALTAALSSSDPNTALNPFVDGPMGSPSLLASIYGTPAVTTFKGDAKIANAFARGALLQLPAGTLDALFGAEYEKSHLVFRMDGRREAKAAFTEMRAPLIRGQGVQQLLAVQAGARYDDYSDFGSKTTWQGAVELRPADSLLVRGGHATAFKPPTLYQLNLPVAPSSALVKDPQHGNASVIVPSLFGGNQHLDPTTGDSSTLGIVWSPPQARGLNISLTAWRLKIDNAINVPSPQFLVDHEAQYPERVVRGPAGDIALIDTTFINFGTMHQRGIDGQVEWRLRTPAGDVTPAVAATYMTKFDGASTPGAPSVDRLSRANTDTIFAPRWKGIASVAWSAPNGFEAWLAGRYIGRYVDYTPPHELGNIWYTDVYLALDVERALGLPKRSLAGLKASLSVTNLFDKLPAWSSYFRGYDPFNYDLVGRTFFLRVQVQH
jgi:iron complex outermembrane receptor protein